MDPTAGSGCVAFATEFRGPDPSPPMLGKLSAAFAASSLTAVLMLACLADWSPGHPPEAAADDPPEARSWRHTDLHARYAEARLRLAETKLGKAERLNAVSPKQVTETDLRSLRTRVEVLRDEVDETKSRPHGYGFAAQRRAARAAVRLAEQEVEAAVAVNRHRADAVAPLDMRMRELRLEIARLRAEIWDDPRFLASSTDVLQMQIDQVADQLQDVLHGVENAPTIDRR